MKVLYLDRDDVASAGCDCEEEEDEEGGAGF